MSNKNLAPSLPKWKFCVKTDFLRSQVQELLDMNQSRQTSRENNIKLTTRSINGTWRPTFIWFNIFWPWISEAKLCERTIWAILQKWPFLKKIWQWSSFDYLLDYFCNFFKKFEKLSWNIITFIKWWFLLPERKNWISENPLFTSLLQSTFQYGQNPYWLSNLSKIMFYMTHHLWIMTFSKSSQDQKYELTYLDW